jgi:hypothetical protein
MILYYPSDCFAGFLVKSQNEAIKGSQESFVLEHCIRPLRLDAGHIAIDGLLACGLFADDRVRTKFFAIAKQKFRKLELLCGAIAFEGLNGRVKNSQRVPFLTSAPSGTMTSRRIASAGKLSETEREGKTIASDSIAPAIQASPRGKQRIRRKRNILRTTDIVIDELAGQLSVKKAKKI